MGWYGRPLAKALQERHNVWGSTRSEAKCAQLRAEGLKAHTLHLDPQWQAAEGFMDDWKDSGLLVLNLPPGRGSQEAEDSYHKKMLEIQKALSESSISRMIFVSSTGVFGSGEGDCHEDSEVYPDRPAGRALHRAEQFWLQGFSGDVHVIRPGGLVGPGRHPGRFLAGRKDLSGKRHPVNFIHLDDLIAMTVAVIEQNPERKIFHAVAADHPAKEEYYAGTAAKMGLERPEFDQGDESPGKRILSEPSRAALDLILSYPSPWDMLP